MASITYKKNGEIMCDINDLTTATMIYFASISDYSISFQCHNVTIMKNAQGDRVIIQEVK